VRALHAKVRRRLLRKANKWDAAEYGVPINQEDMAVTLLAFSYVALVGAEMILGAPLPASDRAAYLHLWRYIGHLLGVADEHNPCAGGVTHAKAHLESILMHVLEPSDLSGQIARHLLRAPLDALRQKSPLWRLWPAASWERSYVRYSQYTRFLIGDTLGDALGLPFDRTQRLLALAYVSWLRVYGRAARTPLLGAVLGGVNRLVMLAGLLVLGGRQHAFPLVYSASEDTGARASASCPFAPLAGRQ
jgi:hypothetical protein